MQSSNTQWTNLASRVVRCVLAKKDVGYAELSRRLSRLGHSEDEKALASRVSLGRIRLSLLLRILSATDADIPVLWRGVKAEDGTWEAASALILREEMRQTLPMSVDELADKLIALGAGFTKKTLVAHIEEGNLFLPDFLKCLIILRSHSLDSFLDYKDIVAAAEAEVASQA